MRKFSTADSETDPFKHGRIPHPFIWGHYNAEEGFKYFFETDDFVQFIKARKEIIYFHNGGKFDVHFLLDYIECQEDIMVVNGRIARIKLGDCEIRDSFMLLPVPLEAYKKDKIDYNKFEETERRKHMPEIHGYLKADCVYLYEVLQKNFELYGQKISLASSAFDFWHKKFSGEKYKPKSNSGFFKTFKPYYYGGRVECFQKGIITEPFDVYDIRSAYPRAMLEEHPYGQEYQASTKLPDSGLEQCFIHFRGTSNGALPFRDKGLSFPRGKDHRDYYCTGWELKTALENNAVKIQRIYRVTRFLQTINFKDYVDYFFREKEKQRGVDDAAYLLAKLYLNSLYGKLGQNSNDHRDYELIEQKHIIDYVTECRDPECEDKECSNKKHQTGVYENVLGKYALVSCPIKEESKIFYNVATAASITGFVRANLFAHIVSAGTPLYCDTDSLACRGFTGQIGPDIGQWEKEGPFKSGAIGGKKLYAFEYQKPFYKNGELVKHKISSKGVKLNANEIYSIAEGEEIEYKNEAPTFSLGKRASFVTRKIRKT